MYERNTAFMRDWYRGPASRKNSKTSASTLSEIGTFAVGNTGTASSQKSGGRSRSSSGAVRAISASVTRRSRARFARPAVGVCGVGLAREDFAVRLAFTTTTHSGRNDSPYGLASLSPIGEDHGEGDPVGEPEGDPTHFSVVLACVDALQSRAGEDERREREVKASLGDIPLALRRVPEEAHGSIYASYIRARKHSVVAQKV
jgi:hypothetical protein